MALRQKSGPKDNVRNKRAIVVPHRVVVLALDRVVPFDLGIAARVFGAAYGDGGEPRYEVVTCSLDGHPVRTSDDYSLVVEHDASALMRADTVVIPTQEPEGLLRESGILPEEVARALATILPEARVVSICTA